jgi:hypothetical protein
MRLPIEQLVAQYCQLQKKGRNFVCLCPFHNDSKPSLLVSPDKGIAYCFACQTGGDIFSFYQAIEGVAFPQALKELAERAGVVLENKPGMAAPKKDEKDRARDCLLSALSFYRAQLSGSASAKEYLAKRAVPAEQIERFEIGVAPDSFSATYEHLLKQGFSRKEILAAGLGVQKELQDEKIYDRFRHRLMFPIHDPQGAIVGFGGRSFFSLQGILTKNNNQYFVKFLEAAPRFTGSTPIMEASLVNFNIFEMLAKWFIDGEIFFGYERRPAIQYSTYIHNHFDTINKLKEKQWIIEAKYEDLSTLQYSEDESKRIRISFYLNNLNELNEKADLIADMCGNKTYRSEINNIFKIFEIEHPLIFENYTKKVLEGNWGSDTIWEFYLSSYLPSKELCSAVFGFPKNGQKFVLTKTERGWEIPGGHIEERENIKDALYREILEEAGLVVNYAMLFGYRKIISNKPLFNKEGKQYPFPISYIPHFIVSFSKDLKKYSGKEVLDRKIFNNNEIVLLDSHVKNIIEIAIANTDRLAS